ncbi:SAM-dependent methyltransferase [Serinibacter arcticus]|uniref:SAM-dependent methyltransferase n=1 Tax=Serinibacter arcticus TaxID=1655435 RepID=A0A2U1ZZ85_9MICO|nr:class I SAM-dependent methyltransferase [Serinibacter arcticus]PWD52243.1 SAM-dependent methyltransferase [Serinibacter arcticus]
MARYTHGHSESVLRSHTWRTARNSAAYLLDDLAPGLDVLDVGCGPGTITVDLADIVAPGRVVGVDTSHEVLLKASELAAARGVSNTLFEPADVFDLPYGSASFDVVHAHQVLQHLDDPVAALREMRRVLRPGGVLAVRDVDYGGMRWFPRLPGLDEWLDLYQQVARRNGGEPDAGPRLLSWVREAGFADTTATASTWCYADDDTRAWWAGVWSERVRHSQFAEHALELGVADTAALDAVAEAWREWGAAEDGWFAMVHGEVVARR